MVDDKEKPPQEQPQEAGDLRGMVRRRRVTAQDAPEEKQHVNTVIKILDKNPLGMTLPEMAGGTRKLKRIRTLRPLLAQAIKEGTVMPISQRAGHTVYRLVKHMGSR